MRSISNKCHSLLAKQPGPCLLSTIASSFLLFSIFFGGGVYAEAVVIAHSETLNAPIARKTLRAVFGMRLQKWPNGHPVKVFVFNDKVQTHKEFCREILGILPYRLRRNWDRLLFSGTGFTPIELVNEGQMLAKIATTPGAIGYINRGNVDDSVSIVSVED